MAHPPRTGVVAARRHRISSPAAPAQPRLSGRLSRPSTASSPACPCVCPPPTSPLSTLPAKPKRPSPTTRSRGPSRPPLRASSRVSSATLRTRSSPLT
ncbi:hypothetical protein EMCG_00389 [[Emmonsia] crescens]|uniref:Uncharacterized protein n=1 Tax=[Emmonsia] crescens TaxID=73230 RepID=A0A0G2HX06_9EURO|nr:hypothetical protein EMCG_00389 [Emmonsia crescens UAMH 3008]